jgi:Zn-dependent peptidase ImmA (M78 family)
MKDKVYLTLEQKHFIINNPQETLKTLANKFNVSIMAIHYYRRDISNKHIDKFDKPKKNRPPAVYSNQVSLYPELGYRGGLGG